MNQIATGTFIARKRRELNLTQAQLAEQLGISSKSVSKWERGKCMPDYGIVNELCDALGITVSELLDGEENERENLRMYDHDQMIEMLARIQRHHYRYHTYRDGHLASRPFSLNRRVERGRFPRWPRTRQRRRHNPHRRVPDHAERFRTPDAR